MKRVILVGASSAIGVFLLERLKKEYEIITVGRRNADITCDLSEKADNIDLPEADIMICLAGEIHAETDEEILRLLDVNVRGTLFLAMLAQKAHVKRIIYISSISALLEAESYYYNYYAISKRMAEDLLLKYCKDNQMKLCILRPSQIYGASWIFEKNQRLIYSIISNAAANKDITLYGKNNAIRNYIYISDVIAVIQGVLNRHIEGVYNVINSQNVCLTDIANVAISIFGSASKIKFLYEKEDIRDNPFYDDGEIFRILDLKEPIGIEEGIKDIFLKWEMMQDGNKTRY